MFPKGTYLHTGLALPAGVRLMGVAREGVTLDYVSNSGNAITLLENPDRVSITDMCLIASGKTSGWMIYHPDYGNSTARELRFANLVIAKSLKGILIVDAQVCVLDHLYLEGHGQNIEGGIGYGDSVVKRRTIVFPDTADIGKNGNDRGIKLGRMLIQSDGTMDFSGGVSGDKGQLVNIGSISATATSAKNLRGQLTIPDGEPEFDVVFATEELDTNYFVVLSGNTGNKFWVTKKWTDSFRVRRDSSAGESKVDWILVR